MHVCHSLVKQVNNEFYDQVKYRNICHGDSVGYLARSNLDLDAVFFIGVGWGWVFLSHCNEVDHDHFTLSVKQYITVIFPINLANIQPIIDTLQDSIETVVMERKHILQEPVIIYPIK